MSGSALNLASIRVDGWNLLNATFTYSSTDGHTFVCTTSTDLTGLIPVGARVKLTDSGTKYFIVTAISSTTITLYGGTSYALTGGAITSPCYSLMKSPLGFNPDPSIWSEQTKSTASLSLSITGGTWGNPGSLKLDVPIGAWKLLYQATVGYAATTVNELVTLSTANNSQSDSELTTYSYADGLAAGNYVPLTREKNVVLAAKTSYFLNANPSATNTVFFRGDQAPTIIRAVCAYL